MATRREMLQALVASAAAVPALAADHPLRRHAEVAGLVEQADGNAAADGYRPEFLSPHQLDTLRSLAERIVPGSTQAKVAEFIDQLLAVDSLDDQRSFVTALGVFEGQALARAARPWKALSDEDQIAVLTSASTQASGRPATPAWQKGQPVPAPPAPQRFTLTLRDHFDLLKGWIAGAYYSTEIGMRELGWTGNMFYRDFPGCSHPDGHA